MVNLYDLTNGNYDVERTLTFPDYPDSKVEFSTQVRAADIPDTFESPCQAVWTTDIEISGDYTGPTEVVGIEGYELTWTSDGRTLTEVASADLLIVTGEVVHSEWTSTIVVTEGELAAMPDGGETATITFDKFVVTDDSLSYEWEGEVLAASP